MYPGFGPQKIEMNKRTGASVPSSEYEAMKNMLVQQADVGTGMALEGTRDPKYGNVNYPGMTQGLVQGSEAMGDMNSNANAPLAKSTAQTAQLGFFSSTQSPQDQPEMMGRAAEDGIKQRILGEPGGLNNREQLYRRGN